jgi:outer membrane protein OmpA-like peptidoglycan-associated protein
VDSNFKREARLETQQNEPAQGVAQGWNGWLLSGRILLMSAAIIVLILGSTKPASAQLSSLCGDMNFKVRFAAGSHELDPVAHRQMDQELKGLLGCRLRRVVVIGFGDAGVGIPQSRLLGERRGEAVTAALSRRGIPAALILTRAGPLSRSAVDPGLNGEAEINIQLSNSLQ